MDRRFLIEVLNQNGVAANLADFERADHVARAEVRRILRSGNPGTDTSRWFAYAGVLMRELKCDGVALERVKAALTDRHMAGALWTYVEDQTVDTLEQLKRAGWRIGVVSNADGRVATFLEKAGLLPYLEIVVDSGVYGVEKPDPRIFQHACELLAVSPRDTIYVGDVYEIDVLGARAAGLTPILIMNGSDDYDCTVIKSIPELPAVLERELNALAN